MICQSPFRCLVSHPGYYPPRPPDHTHFALPPLTVPAPSTPPVRARIAHPLLPGSPRPQETVSTMICGSPRADALAMPVYRKRPMTAEHLSEPLRGPPQRLAKSRPSGGCSLARACGRSPGRGGWQNLFSGPSSMWRRAPLRNPGKARVSSRRDFTGGHGPPISHRPPGDISQPRSPQAARRGCFFTLRLLRPPPSERKRDHPKRVVSSLCRRRPIFPVRLQTSIFGTTELNFRVRDGNGWTLSVINTYYLMYQKYIEN